MEIQEIKDHASFVAGFFYAELFYGMTFKEGDGDRLIQKLNAIISGEETLIGTREEFFKEFSLLPESLLETLLTHRQNGVEYHKKAARIILHWLSNYQKILVELGKVV